MCIKKMKSLVLYICLVLIFGCAMSNAHQQFINSMNAVVLSKVKFNDESFDPSYPNGKFIADKRYLTHKNLTGTGEAIYHYARPNIWDDRFCNYYLVVDIKTDIIIDWGFDYDVSDPKKECGASG